MNTKLLGSGKCSFFGGPNDTGVGVHENLSCIEPSDLSKEWFSRLFSPINSSFGLARNLNPRALYCAMRWNYGSFDGKRGEILPELTREQIRYAMFYVQSDHGSCFVQAADFGPNWDTGRFIDLSPGVLPFLGVSTDDIVTVTAIW